MTTISKNYGFPTGYFSLIYNYLCDTGQLNREKDEDLIDLFVSFGYPDYIVPYLALEYRGYVFNNLDAEIDWTKGLTGKSDAEKRSENDAVKGSGKRSRSDSRKRGENDSVKESDSDSEKEASEQPDLSSSD